MKWFIASDIHGSEYYLNKMLELYNKEKADRLILLGDILYHGPRNDLPYMYNPKAVISALNNIKDNIICVRGNCDTEVDQMVLDFPILADYAILCDGDLTMYLTHGHLLDNSKVLGNKKDDIILFGHTHIPECTNKDNRLYINPGSVSIPKESSKNSCIVYENRCFSFKTLDGETYLTKEV